MKQTEIIKLLTQPLSKRIDQQNIEKWASSLWKSFKSPDRDHGSSGSPFVIMFPPPNITGNLHLGHALTGALEDALVRQRKMRGHRCLFIPGFDHAGLATQSIVERYLWNKHQITRVELGRDKFIDLANDWKDVKRTEMRQQLDRLGLALDHDREYFTMDATSSQAVRVAFKQLFESNLVYRSTRDIFWSEQLQSTLSDIEVENVDGQNRYVRTGEVVKKRSLSQWFIDADLMARKAVDAVDECSIDMIPANYKRSWSSWLLANGVQDWCISRQSWWGHRIPAYKKSTACDKIDNWVVAENLDEARSKLDVADVHQDPDVLDTWFSSSLLPLTVSGWPDTERFTTNCEHGFFPLHIMETGFDILTYWVSKMAMICIALTGKVPFRLVLLHGMICDSDGKKMSKSRGNVIDPIDVIDGASLDDLQQRAKDANKLGILENDKLTSVLENQKRLFPTGIPMCGADGLRAYLLSHDVQEEVVKIQISQIDKIRRLSNKIWNIFRFYLSILTRPNLADISLDIGQRMISPLVADRHDDEDQQVLRKLAICVRSAEDSFNQTYQLQHCLNQLELFWIVDLSQNYIPTLRTTVMDGSSDLEDKKIKLQVLTTCLITAIKLLHPFMPHQTEFLYQKLVHDISRRESKALQIVKSSGETDHQISKLLIYESYPNVKDWREFL